MSDAWLAFARTGNPQTNAFAAWPVYSLARRATMVFDRSGHPSLAGGWRCLHSHLSLNRGVPQTSHASRPVRGR
jgi:hypothetical protein